MSQFDGPRSTNPEKPDWSELDADPKFQENFLVFLRILLAEKKFGQEIYEDYEMLSILKELKYSSSKGQTQDVNDLGAFNGVVARVSKDGPSVNEIYLFEEKTKRLKTLEEVIAFSKEENIEITSEELAQAKKNVIELMEDDTK
jgi:predicted RNA methylase